MRSSKTLLTFNYAGWLIINKDPLQRLIVIPIRAILQSHQIKRVLILRTLRYASEHVRFIFTLYKVEEIRSRPVIFWLWPGKDLKDFSSSNCHTFYPRENTLYIWRFSSNILISTVSWKYPPRSPLIRPSHDINPNCYDIIQHNFFHPMANHSTLSCPWSVWLYTGLGWLVQQGLGEVKSGKLLWVCWPKKKTDGFTSPIFEGTFLLGGSWFWHICEFGESLAMSLDMAISCRKPDSLRNFPDITYLILG